jgi:hypothetical protein
MVKTLIVFWHGLGDNILATPAIKKFKETTGDYIGWMMKEHLLPSRGCDLMWLCLGQAKRLC